MAMRVVVPAVDTSPHLGAVCDSLVGVAHEVHIVHGDTGYWRLMADLWKRAEGVILVEHDVLADRAAIDDLITCPADWCAASYNYGNGYISGLGCTKFSKALMERVPDALLRAGERSDSLHPKKHWCRLDASLHRVLVDSGVTMCFAAHQRRHLVHLNTARSAHGCRGS